MRLVKTVASQNPAPSALTRTVERRWTSYWDPPQRRCATLGGRRVIEAGQVVVAPPFGGGKTIEIGNATASPPRAAER